jgi:lactoylglutathione lyase
MMVPSRIVHLALKVADLERATHFYEDVFGFRQTGTGHARGHVSRHMTDGAFDLALMVYDSEDEPEAQLSGSGPCIHHFGIEVADRDATAERIVAYGGKIISDPNEGALKFRAPNGIVAEITRPGRYRNAQINAARIRGVSIAAVDAAASVAFYKSVFGFDDASNHANAHELTAGQFRLTILERAALPARHHHWTIVTADPETLAKSLTQHGAAQISEAGTPLYRTPDGSLLEITTG